VFPPTHPDIAQSKCNLAVSTIRVAIHGEGAELYRAFAQELGQATNPKITRLSPRITPIFAFPWSRTQSTSSGSSCAQETVGLTQRPSVALSLTEGRLLCLTCGTLAHAHCWGRRCLLLGGGIGRTRTRLRTVWATRGGRVLSRAALVDICEAFSRTWYGEGVPPPFRGGFVRNRVSHNLMSQRNEPGCADRVKGVVPLRWSDVSGLSMRNRPLDFALTRAQSLLFPAHDGQGKDHSPHAQGKRRRLTNYFFPSLSFSRPTSFHQIWESFFARRVKIPPFSWKGCLLFPTRLLRCPRALALQASLARVAADLRRRPPRAEACGGSSEN